MSKYEIWSRQDATALEPEILYGAIREDIEATQRAWSMYKRLFSPPHLPPNHDWNWSEKVSTTENQTFVTLRYAGETHGMMMVAMDAQPCRIPGSTHKKLLYVEYIETAPWNHRFYAREEVRFLGVGACLLRVAVDLSIASHCEGRLGLHSLPEVKSFYEKRGFRNLGEDVSEQLDYMELSDAALEQWDRPRIVT